MLTAVVTAAVTAALTYFGPTMSAVDDVENDSQRRHVISCANAEVNRALIRQAAEGLMEPTPVPEGALPALRQYIELTNAEKLRSKQVIERNTATPVECLRDE